ARSAAGQGLTITQIEKTWTSLTELDQYDLDHFDQTLEVYRNAEVYPHLLRLATGLESVVVGKEEILNEMKSSIANAKESKVSGTILNKLFDTVIRVGTKIRESTGIGDNVLTIGDVAVQMAEESVGIDAKKKVLLMGTGEVAAQIAKSMNKKNYAFDVVSRTIERATGFSKILKGTPVEFTDVMENFAKYDIVFVATTSDYHILTENRIRRVMEDKKSGTMVLDISEPRAVNEDISAIPGLKLMFRDQIDEQQSENLQARQAKIPDVEKLIAKETPIIEAMMNKLEPEPIVTDVVATVDTLRKQELEKAIKELGVTDESKIKILEDLTKSVVDKIITTPKKEEKPAQEQESSS
ncbi:MAG: glutamyl-tRNA reductase, partial [Nitrosopumilaceae archaeon]|nr:glutamyl-tRNA reductase [Nitrosopumilaceae archaeon]